MKAKYIKKNARDSKVFLEDVLDLLMGSNNLVIPIFKIASAFTILLQ